MYNDYGSAGQLLGGFIGGILVFALIIFVIALAVAIIQLIGQWKIYKKAGKGGWEVLIPFYTNWVLVEIAGLKWYWFLGFFAPIVFQIIGLGFLGWIAYYFLMFNISYNLSKRFNKGVGFAICTTLFTPICFAILGFSKNEIYDKNIPVSEHGVFKTSENTVQQQTSQLFCMYCGNKVNLNDKFCTSCGSKINVVKDTCENCGEKIKPDDKFCTNCGKRL